MPDARDIDSALLAIPPGLPSQRPGHAPPLPNIADDLDAVIERAREAALRAEPDPNEGKRVRGPKARDVLFQVPGFVRHVPSAELLARVKVPALKAAVSAWRWGDPGILMLGHTRIGKTTAAAWLFRRLIAEGWASGGPEWELVQRMRWYAAETLMRARVEHPFGMGEAPEIVQANTASLLVIDDAGWDQRDPSAVSHVLNARYEADPPRPTIVTSGQTQAALGVLYGAAVIRRLAEAGGRAARVVECFGAEK